MVYDVAMHRTQLLFENWQYEALKAMAEAEGKSLSALVREILARHLKGGRARSGSGPEAIEGLLADHEVSGRTHDQALYRQGRRERR
ncbi:MAG: ribbon-helix-helix protein, CopG family [Planctomycetes bacterium]|nr:ribbon-helix-helix protein, CopG family [Planctomycetota bacterium]